MVHYYYIGEIFTSVNQESWFKNKKKQNCGQFELFSLIPISDIIIMMMTLSNFYRVKSIWLIFQPLFHSFVSFSFQNNVYSNSKEITCKQNVNNFWMNVIWLVKCKWNVLSRRSGKIMEIMFKEKKTFFLIGVFFSVQNAPFPLQFLRTGFFYIILPFF